MQVSLFFAYGVASAFFHVYDVAVDTMLVCFLVVRLRCGRVAKEVGCRAAARLRAWCVNRAAARLGCVLA